MCGLGHGAVAGVVSDRPPGGKVVTIASGRGTLPPHADAHDRGRETHVRLHLLAPDLDARLVERCLTGDPRAWDALVRRYERLVYSIARSYRLPDADVADVFQDVFAALVRNLPRLRDARTLCRWLAITSDRIARATALLLRREHRMLADDPEASDRHPDGAEPVGSDLELFEEQGMIRFALARLPSRCRSLLEALYYEDPTPSYAELAQRFGVPIGSLGPTRARCMDRLRAVLAGTLRPDAGIKRTRQPTFSEPAV